MKGKQYHPSSELFRGDVCPRVVIAGLKGGSGKTLLALGIIKSWRDRGLNIVPFKKGPDYIDAGWLAYAAGKPCYNLDQFLTGEEKVLSSFIEHTIGANGAVIEGSRGLYDGMDVDGTYSTAELSKIIKSPVVLILDCTKTTRTAAAMILGCLRFDPEVSIRGVILNQIANSRHESIIRRSIERYSNLPVLGAIPRLREGSFGERHMGLIPYQEHLEPTETLDTLRSLAERHIDLDGIWKVANEAPPLEAMRRDERQETSINNSSLVTTHSSLRIGVIKDSAFQFYYPENLTELIGRGATLIEINALKDMELPEIDALYIGGGFPETHALALAENTAFRSSLCKAIEAGLPVYAECGGLMYLGEAILIEGKTYPMSGVFPIIFSLEKIPQAHGYTIVEVERPNPYFPVGFTLKGHEFHYSRVIDPESTESGLFLIPKQVREVRGEGSGAVSQLFGRDDIYFAFKMKRGQGLINKMDGLCYKNVLATYTHLHALGTNEWVDGIIRQAISYRGKRLLIKN